LVNDITKQLEANYGKQIENLNNNIVTIEKTNEREVSLLSQQLEIAKQENSVFNDQIQELQKQVEKAGRISVYTVLTVIAALVTGWLIGKVLS
jgi:uncharacterized protein YigA (DUF484 family)